MNQKTFLEKYEFLIPLGLFILFLVLTLPGISWGAPAMWYPDEIVARSMKALFEPEYHFDEVNFDYPTLPQYVMYGLGKVILSLGYLDREILISARVLSAVTAARGATWHGPAPRSPRARRASLASDASRAARFVPGGHSRRVRAALRPSRTRATPRSSYDALRNAGMPVTASPMISRCMS